MNAFLRGVFAGARVVPRVRPHSLARGLDVGIYNGLSPQSTGLSSPLSVSTQRLATEIVFYRDFFGGVLSDLRSPGSVGRSAGAVFVRACVGDHTLQIYKYPLPAQTRRPYFLAMTS